VHPFAQTREGDGIDVVPLLSESPGDFLPTPAPQPTSTDQDVDAHPKDLLLRQRPSLELSHYVSAPLKQEISENTLTSCPLAMHYAIELMDEEAREPPAGKKASS
jgi:hypothetical protein